MLILAGYSVWTSAQDAIDNELLQHEQQAEQETAQQDIKNMNIAVEVKLKNSSMSDDLQELENLTFQAEFTGEIGDEDEDII